MRIRPAAIEYRHPHASAGCASSLVSGWSASAPISAPGATGGERLLIAAAALHFWFGYRRLSSAPSRPLDRRHAISRAG